jgi:hypothetical protein
MKAWAEQSHEPVHPGTYLDPDRTLHEKDRKAKWGSTRAEADNYGRKMNRIQAKNLIPADEMKLVRASSENRPNDRLAKYAIDGRPRSVWHSHFASHVEKHPHEVVIDLEGTYNIEGFRYLARQDRSWNGAFAKTEFFVSDSADAFGDPVAKATFKKDKESQSADCKTPVRGRYVLVRILSEVNGGPWASAAEIGVIGTKAEK